jgi:hypothetical protein
VAEEGLEPRSLLWGPRPLPPRKWFWFSPLVGLLADLNGGMYLLTVMHPARCPGSGFQASSEEVHSYSEAQTALSLSFGELRCDFLWLALPTSPPLALNPLVLVFSP